MKRCVIAVLCWSCLALAAQAAEKDFAVQEGQLIMVLGDSITADSQYAQIMQDYVDQRFPQRRIRLITSGSSGSTVSDNLPLLDERVVRWRPDWVLINLGTNDLRYSPDDFRFYYEALINRLERDTNARLCLIDPIWFNQEPEKHAQFLQVIKELAEKYDCVHVPCQEYWQTVKAALPAAVKASGDAVHPHVLGYWIYAQSILQKLDFPFAAEPKKLSIPYTRASHVNDPEARSAIGAEFVMPLPQPVQVSITDFTPKKFVVTQAAQPIKIDGDLSEWSIEPQAVVDQAAQRVAGVYSWWRDNPAMTVRACYRDDGLYFGFEVQTPVVLNSPDAVSVMRDCIELFLDLRTEAERPEGKRYDIFGQKRVGQLILAPATKSVKDAQIAMGSGDKALMDGVKVASKMTARGYSLECFVPASHFHPEQFQSGQTFGADFTMVDVDRFEAWQDIRMLRYTGCPYSFFTAIEYARLQFGPQE